MPFSQVSLIKGFWVIFFKIQSFLNGYLFGASLIIIACTSVIRTCTSWNRQYQWRSPSGPGPPLSWVKKKNRRRKKSRQATKYRPPKPWGKGEGGGGGVPLDPISDAWILLGHFWYGLDCVFYEQFSFPWQRRKKDLVNVNEQSVSKYVGWKIILLKRTNLPQFLHYHPHLLFSWHILHCSGITDVTTNSRIETIK